MYHDGCFCLIPTCHPTHAHTDRITEGAPKKFLRNRNRDSCEKSATGAENTGILRVPAGITNLDLKCVVCHLSSVVRTY